MLINSLDFLIFFFITGVVFYAIPGRFRWMLLLVASYVFCLSWEPSHALLLAFLTIFNYFAALRIGRAETVRGKKLALVLSILSNAGLLFVFKYTGFFTGAIGTLTDSLHLAVAVPVVSIALPLGISFYTLKIMNYTIDVYRGKLEPEKKLGYFALFVAFFPQFMTGPIDRATNLLPQFHERRSFDYKGVTDGLKLILWGFFQKMVIADNLAAMVDKVFNKPAQYDASVLALAVLLFSFQIYCDFSGYSDIAIGIARVFGYKSIKNFDLPYFSQSVPEFWRRWHISLSTWFRDYLYIPLGGNRTSVIRWYGNLMIVFLVSGLWHGANWTFIAWGALHGVYCVVSVITRGARDRMSAALGLTRLPVFHRWFRTVLTFCLVAFAWIFFKAHTISDSFFMVGRVFGWTSAPAGDTTTLVSYVRANFYEFSVAVAAIVIMEIVQGVQMKGSVRDMLGHCPAWLRWPAYYALAALVLLFGSFGGKQFIYFQF